MAEGLLSGVLPYIYSQGDRLKNRLSAVLSDPLGSIAQTGGQITDNGREQSALMQAAFGNQARPFQVTDQNALGQAVDNTLQGTMGFSPAGIMVYRAGAPRGMTADAGGPTFYATQKAGAEPFSRGGQSQILEHDIAPANVLDTQIQPGRALYQQFLSETKHPAGYGQTARPYWTAEHEFKKWLDAKGHKFDAIMFDEPTGVPSYATYGN